METVESGLSTTKRTRDRSRPIWFVAFALTALIAAMGLSSYLTPKEIISWRSDFADARAESQQAAKPLMLYFTADWCGPCQQMKRTVWADKEVDQALQAFVPTRIDIDVNPELAIEYQVDSVPQMLILADDGRVLKRNDIGSQTPAEFLSWLKRS